MTSLLHRLCRFFLLSTLLAGAAAHAQYSVTTSNAPIPRVREFKAFHLIVVEREFRPPGLATSAERDKALVEAKYFDFGGLMQQRAPQVFDANGLQARVTVIQAQDGPAVLPADIEPEAGVIVIDPTDFSKRSKGLFLTFVNVNFAVLLLEPGAEDPKRLAPLWRLGQGLQLGPDPLLGVLKKHRVDADSVDALMMGLLNTLGEKGFVALPDGKAVKPKG
jgi:hypothetical protein